MTPFIRLRDKTNERGHFFEKTNYSTYTIARHAIVTFSLCSVSPCYDNFTLLAPGAHSQFGSGKNTQFEPEQRANPFENVFSKTAVFPPPAIAETDL